MITFTLPSPVRGTTTATILKVCDSSKLKRILALYSIGGGVLGITLWSGAAEYDALGWLMDDDIKARFIQKLIP